MKPPFRLSNTLAALLFFVFAGLAPTALLASDAGGGGAPEPLIFTVNLGSNYLQIGLLIEAATPEAKHELAVFKPKIQHAIILLLSGRDDATLRTLPGKKALVADIISSVNHVIHDDEKTGVNSVLFSNFIIQ